MKQLDRIKESNQASLSLSEMSVLMVKGSVVFPKRKAFFLKSKAQLKLGNYKQAMKYISIDDQFNRRYRGKAWRNKQLIYGFQEIYIILAMGDASSAYIKLGVLRSIAKNNNILFDWLDVYRSLILFRLNDIGGALQAAEQFRTFNMYVDGVYCDYNNWVELLKSKM